MQVIESAEEIFKRVQQNSKIKQLMTYNSDGLCIRSTIDHAKSVQYGAHFFQLTRRLELLLRDFDGGTVHNSFSRYPVNMIRINTKHHELIIAPGIIRACKLINLRIFNEKRE